MLINNVTVGYESFEEIEKRQSEIKEELAKTKAFRTKDYLDKELTWNRNDNSYYNDEGQKLNMGPETIYLGKGSLW